MRLQDMANYLYQSDLQVTPAVNLDGGVSTSLYIGANQPPYLVAAKTKIPAVVAGYATR